VEGIVVVVDDDEEVVVLVVIVVVVVVVVVAVVVVVVEDAGEGVEGEVASFLGLLRFGFVCLVSPVGSMRGDVEEERRG
jgi:uncharacterized membrane protein